MYEQTIQIGNFNFIDFQQIDIIKKPDAHLTALIIGHIPKEEGDIAKHVSNDPIEIRCISENGQEKTIFVGKLEKVLILEENGLISLHLELISFSILMDYSPEIRTFQDSSSTYSFVTQTVMAESGNCIIFVPDNDSTSIEKMLIQYAETDWNFARRIASRLHTHVFVNAQSMSPSISIGPVQAKNSFSLQSTEYTVEKDLRQYEECKARGVNSITENRCVFYTVKSREIFDLCDEVQFQGNSLLVYSIETHLEGAILQHYYTLKFKEGLKQPEYFNQSIIGMSLRGKISAVEKDQVKVEIFNDVQSKTYQWFSFSTVYSSPDDTGWYFMPEIGDTVRLTFPSEHEEDAYVISSEHMGDRADADIKSIRTKYQKSIVFMPDSILITNGMGSSIRLDDQDGIQIQSTKAIQISADEDIQIESRSKVLINGDEGVRFQQAGNQINIEDNIDMAAGHIRTR